MILVTANCCTVRALLETLSGATIYDSVQNGFLNARDKSKLKKIKRDIDGHSLDAAYNQIKTLELTSKNEPTKRLYAIYAHVIRVYKERAYILRTIRVISEADSLIKLWGEVFELLFGGNQEIYLRWRETTSGVTTQKKRLNRSSDKNIVGMKVDCRAVVFFERENLDVDLMNMEAAIRNSYF